MAQGHWRKHRYIVRTKDGEGIGTSSTAQVKLLAKKYDVDCVETELGDMTLEDFLIYMEREEALPVQYPRGRSKLFKT